MKKKDLIETLKEKKLLCQVTNELELQEELKKNNIVFYCGFDPTADSLHIGHLIPLFCIKIFQDYGHKAIILIGGATAVIGDPSFKKSKRKNLLLENINLWSKKIKKQIVNFFKRNGNKNNVIIVNNFNWFNKLNILDFLSVIGKNFSINQMINKDIIKKRLRKNNLQGLSFTEFSYVLMQSYDFYHLNKKFNSILQIGGSDQWGNIISGIHLIGKIEKTKTFGLTLPLITKKNGEKFGKTGQDTIWLDSKKTSPYKFYQFWINIKDEDIKYFLELFTNIKIATNNNNIEKNVKPRFYQNILAENLTFLIHGYKGLKSAKRITKSLFENNINLLKIKDFQQLSQDGMNKINLKKQSDILDALVKAKLSSSRTQSKYMINSNAISINGKKQKNDLYSFSEKDKIFKKFTLICRGKKHYCLIVWL